MHITTKYFGLAKNRPKNLGVGNVRVIRQVRHFHSSILVLIALCIFGQGSAQETPKGWTSYIDLIYTDLYQTPLAKLPECVAAAPDALTALECYHNLEIVDAEAFAECQDEALVEAACGHRLGYPTPFWPDDLGFIVEDVYQEIYDRYYANVWKYGLQQLLPCLASACTNGACISNAVQNIIRHAYGSLNTIYWLEIFTASLYYLNSTTWYQLPFPDYGGILLPVFSEERKLEQYGEYAERINDVDEQQRGDAYTFTNPLFQDLPVPYDPSETRRSYPGLYDFEQLKDELEPATLLEYQQFGFSTIFQAYGDRQLVVVAPLPCIFALPLPEVRLASTDWVTIPEGYEIPHTAERPWVPAAQPTAILAPDLVLGLALDPTPPPVVSEEPLTSVLSCPPMTLADLAPINILENQAGITLEDLGNNTPLLTSIQYLLRDYLLRGYDDEGLALAEANGLDFIDLEATGIFDGATQEAINYFQGQENLSVTGILDGATLLALGSSSCPGDEGDAVAGLQSALGVAGFDLPITRIFDEATRAALTSFQEASGLDVTGIADLKTWQALFSQN